MAAALRVSPLSLGTLSSASTLLSRPSSSPAEAAVASRVQSPMLRRASSLGWNSRASPMARRHCPNISLSLLVRSTLNRWLSASGEPIFPMAAIATSRTAVSSSRGASARTAR